MTIFWRIKYRYLHIIWTNMLRKLFPFLLKVNIKLRNKMQRLRPRWCSSWYKTYAVLCGSTSGAAHCKIAYSSQSNTFQLCLLKNISVYSSHCAKSRHTVNDTFSIWEWVFMFNKVIDCYISAPHSCILPLDWKYWRIIQCRQCGPETHQQIKFKSTKKPKNFVVWKLNN